MILSLFLKTKTTIKSKKLGVFHNKLKLILLLDFAIIMKFFTWLTDMILKEEQNLLGTEDTSLKDLVCFWTKLSFNMDYISWPKEALPQFKHPTSWKSK